MADDIRTDDLDNGATVTLSDDAVGAITLGGRQPDHLRGDRKHPVLGNNGNG